MRYIITTATGKYITTKYFSSDKKADNFCKYILPKSRPYEGPFYWEKINY